MSRIRTEGSLNEFLQDHCIEQFSQGSTLHINRLEKQNDYQHYQHIHSSIPLNHNISPSSDHQYLFQELAQQSRYSSRLDKRTREEFYYAVESPLKKISSQRTKPTSRHPSPLAEYHPKQQQYLSNYSSQNKLKRSKSTNQRATAKDKQNIFAPKIFSNNSALETRKMSSIPSKNDRAMTEEAQLSKDTKSSQNIKIGDQIMTPSSRNAIRKNHLLLKTAVKIDRQDQRLHSGEQASNLSYKRLFKELLFEDITAPQDKNGKNDLTTEQSELCTNQSNMSPDANDKSFINENKDDYILKLHSDNNSSQFKDRMHRFRSKGNPKDYLRKLDALQWAKNHNKQYQNSFNKYKAQTQKNTTAAVLKNQNISYTPQKYVSSEYINKIFQVAPLIDYKLQKYQQKGQNNNSSMLIFAKRKSSIQYMINNADSPSQRIQLNLINGGFSEKCIAENENENMQKSQQQFLGIQNQKQRARETYAKNIQQQSPSFGPTSFMIFKNDMSPMGSQDIQKDKRTRNHSIDFSRSQSYNKNNISSSSSNVQPASDSQGSISTARKNGFSRRAGVGLKNSPREVIKGLQNIISELSKDK